METEQKKPQSPTPQSDNDDDSEYESEEFCQQCGKVLHTRHDKCQHCDKEGPFCNVCLSHHIKHCQNEQDITPNEELFRL